MRRLNLVFHDIKNNPNGAWQVNTNFFLKIFKWCQKNINDFCIYFDDGKALEPLKDRYELIGPYINLAIVTGDVGKQGYFRWVELKQFTKLGFAISSHSVSHPSLCYYDEKDKKILPNPSDGEYIYAPRGKQLLNENQVKYQLVESKRALEKHNFSINEFVFPYGLYSQQTIKILDELSIYKYYATCDSELYTGGKLVPRVLIYGNKTVEDNLICLTKVINESK